MAKKKRNKIELDFNKFINAEYDYRHENGVVERYLKIHIDDGDFIISTDEDLELILTSPTNQKTDSQKTHQSKNLKPEHPTHESALREPLALAP